MMRSICQCVSSNAHIYYTFTGILNYYTLTNYYYLYA